MTDAGLEVLQTVMQRVLDEQREMRRDIHDVKLRRLQIEAGIGAVRRDLGRPRA